MAPPVVRLAACMPVASLHFDESLAYNREARADAAGFGYATAMERIEDSLQLVVRQTRTAVRDHKGRRARLNLCGNFNRRFPWRVSGGVNNQVGQRLLGQNEICFHQRQIGRNPCFNNMLRNLPFKVTKGYPDKIGYVAPVELRAELVRDWMRAALRRLCTTRFQTRARGFNLFHEVLLFVVECAVGMQRVCRAGDRGNWRAQFVRNRVQQCASQPLGFLEQFGVHFRIALSTQAGGQLSYG